MTLCGLAVLPGCGDFDFSDFLTECSPGTDPEDCDAVGDDTEPPPSALDITGTWSGTEVDSSTCGAFDGPRFFIWDIVQTGDSVRVVSIDGDLVLTGKITGNSMNLQGSFFRGGGITEVIATDITVGSTGSTIEGSETWFWTGVGEPCSGTTLVNGIRN